ncbi:hypothetical protein K490DRAFT_65161 [Saccharata proteae CBS 121410]|uniref:Uncharacterized protein n=1 Tax=Saccharata proteae CBS 121410 TaxID=1314787 RepID=A0A9P4M0G2_9PEZI|nr:hypothetical protein K490DRAFT_65161 [Saccharata proteae CBS 121410]
MMGLSPTLNPADASPKIYDSHSNMGSSLHVTDSLWDIQLRLNTWDTYSSNKKEYKKPHLPIFDLERPWAYDWFDEEWCRLPVSTKYERPHCDFVLEEAGRTTFADRLRWKAELGAIMLAAYEAEDRPSYLPTDDLESDASVSPLKSPEAKTAIVSSPVEKMATQFSEDKPLVA